MRINIRGPLISGKATEEGGGVYDFAFVILEAGGVYLKNKLKLTLENLEFILTSFILFKVGNFRSLRAPGGGYFIYLGTGPKDITIGGYYP